MTRRLYLHIGQPKTATTALQGFLCDNAAALAGQGYLYPKAGRQGLAHHCLGNFFRDAPVDWIRPADPQAMRDALLHEVDASGCDQVILSTEALYYRGVRLEQVVDFFAGFEVTVIVALRRQDDWLESALRDNIKTGHYAGPPEAYVASRHGAVDYHHRLGLWAACFGAGNIIVQPFEGGSGDLDVERRFLTAIGARHDPSMPRAASRNDRLSQECLAFLGMMQEQKRFGPRYTRWGDILADWSRLHPDPAPRRYILSPALRAAIVARHEEGNAAVARAWLGRDRLFAPPPASPAPWEPYPGLSPQRAVRIGEYLARRLDDLPPPAR